MFLVAAFWFLSQYRRDHSKSNYYFAGFCLLNGVAGLSFIFSYPWDAGWWLWHVMRIGAYIILLIYMYDFFVQVIEAASASHYTRSLIEASIDPLMMISPEGKITDVNDAVIMATGVERENLIGSNFSKYFTEPEKADAVYRDILAGLTIRDYPLTLWHISGTTIEVRFNATTYRNQKGDSQGVFAAAHDITRLKQVEDSLMAKNVDLEAAYEEITATEEELRSNYEELAKNQQELRESEERFRMIFECSTVGKLLISLDGRLLKINQAFADLLGYTIEELLNINVTQITHPDDIALNLESYRSLLANEQTNYRLEKRYIHKSGRIVWADVSNMLLRDKSGTSLNFIAGIIDITGKKQIEDALMAKNMDLEAAYEEITATEEELRQNYDELAKSQQALRETQEELVRKEKLAVLGKLSGGVGHELRNPLGAIKNAAYFLNLALENPDPDVKETLDIINMEIARSEDIISSLLDFARPKVPVQRIVNVNNVLIEAVSRYNRPKNVTVINKTDQNIQDIQADPDKLLQVFGNLITNAYQAMPDGGTLTISSNNTDSDTVVVTVTDTGTGITEENQKKMFEPLFTTKAKGIGLGLVVSEMIVKAHGGQIDLQSAPGQGTVFTVILPVCGKGDT